jgi:hypothetical protein
VDRSFAGDFTPIIYVLNQMDERFISVEEGIRQLQGLVLEGMTCEEASYVRHRLSAVEQLQPIKVEWVRSLIVKLDAVRGVVK